MNPRKVQATSFIGLVVSLGALLILFVLLFSVVRQTTIPKQGALQTPVASATSTQFPLPLEEWKETAQAAVMHTHMALIETVTPLSPPTCCPPTITLRPFIPGIYDVPYIGELRGSSLSNRWQEIINGERVKVSAGALRDASGNIDDKARGIVVVKIYSKDFSNSSRVIYEAPGTTGMLKIISVTGYRLTLLGQNGATLYFDVPTRQFVDGPTVKVAPL